MVGSFIVSLVSLLTLLSNASTGQAASIGKSSASPTVVDLGYTKLQGTYNATSQRYSWWGIKFAQGPVGSLRFQAPLPIASQSNIPPLLNATVPAAQCWQWATDGIAADPKANDILTSEDCLSLDVHLPAGADPSKGAKLPVLLYIHGGGYANGNSFTYTPDNLYRSPGSNFVFISIQYRLGPLGWLGGSEIKEGAVVNAGLLDQREAFRWVRQNIHKFGGDPERVTIMGESAGAQSILQHAVADGGQTNPPLFKNAIALSVYQGQQWRYDDEPTQILYNQIVNVTGCATSTDTLQCLTGLNITDTVYQYNALVPGRQAGAFVLNPMVDDEIITDLPTRLISRGISNIDKLWVNIQEKEALYPVDNPLYPIGVTSEAGIVSWAREQFGYNDTIIDNILAAYSANDFATADLRLQQMYGDSSLACNGLDFASFHVRPSYLSLNVIPRHNDHGDDLAIYFLSGQIGTPVEEETAIMRNYVVNFATKNGDIGLAAWPRIHEDLTRPNAKPPIQKVYNVTESNSEPDNRFAPVD